MKHFHRIIALIVGAALALAASEAWAGRCDGDFEWVRGAWVATPYCRAVTIAEAARDSGVHVSPETLLRHPGRADEVCRFLDSDIRVHPACENLRPLLEFSW